MAAPACYRRRIDPYDRVPYTDHAYAESHPDRLAVVARLSGWEAPAVVAARVLEIGCGRGGNLLPMATSLPRATLVGVDPLALGRDLAVALRDTLHGNTLTGWHVAR